ncbi:MAG: sigma-70 family RNA polymerase sigma factor [Vicinamibacterales bacterium]
MTPDQEHALADLMARSQRGDAGAYDTLLRELRTLIDRFVRRRVGDVPWVDDVTQDALVSIHRDRHTWNPARPFVPWLYAVVQSRLIDVIRRERRLRGREASDDDALVRARVRSAETAVLAARDVRAAVAQLGPTQRRVIELLKLEERSVQDVARALALTDGNVRVIAHRAMKALRLLLGDARDRTA